MTREEQIDWLCRLRADLSNGIIFTPWNEEFTEALDGILEQEPCEDAISRQAAIYVINHAQVNFSVESEIDFTRHVREVHEIIENVLHAQEKALKELPPVTPAEKVGQWIDHQEDRWIYAKCSKCETVHDSRTNYCPYCGVKMQEAKK